ELLREAYNFHGEKCSAIAIAAKIAYDAAQTLGASIRDISLRLPRNMNPHVADGLIGISKATLGNTRLTFFEDPDTLIFTAAKSIRYHVFDVPDLDAQSVLKLGSDELFAKL
ncbi:MAG: hypothetical protein WCI87_09440, partial [Euryarchaeota archaeon]